MVIVSYFHSLATREDNGNNQSNPSQTRIENDVTQKQDIKLNNSNIITKKEKITRKRAGREERCAN